MSEQSIIKNLATWLDNRKFPFQIPCSFIYDWESDYWCMTSEGETREFEIKISRSDYAIDKKKGKHSDITKGANYFYYVCPENMIAREEVSSKYGLIYVKESGYLTVIKKPQRLNDFKFIEWKKLANKMYWKWYTLWCVKLKNKEITKDEFYTGFNIDLTTEDTFN